jgi:hypothetical protein
MQRSRVNSVFYGVLNDSKPWKDLMDLGLIPAIANEAETCLVDSNE